ncbi:MAG: SPFH domain-containing protein [Clostridia bacterium]|nr:SPFH domain-containing protein [Clostridia bacterium]
MGLIKAAIGSIGGALGDAWLDAYEAKDMSDTTVFTKGVRSNISDRSSNKKGTDDVISNGSKIHVYPGQFMMLVDGGKIVDYTAEEGYYTVDNNAAPSLFNGDFGDSLKDVWQRFKFGGTPSYSQKAYFINMQEIKGIKFGTPTAVNYFDGFYNSELFLRAHGTYSIKVTNPILFYTEAIPKNATYVDINDINEQYLAEFLNAFGAALNKMSVDGIRVSHVASKSLELSKYMATELDEEWNKTRGFEVAAVGIASISYDEESKKLIEMRNKGAMLSDPTVREGYVQGSIARGFEAAGSNSGGSAQTFMGMGMGMGAAGSFMGTMSETNRAQMQEERAAAAVNANANTWKCACGAECSGNFCPNCGAKKPVANVWKCTCGEECSGNFCPNCGAKKKSSWKCPECETENEGKFCQNCGHKNEA